MKPKNNPIVLIAMTIISIACLVPFLMALAASFTGEAALKTHGYGLWPSEFSMEAYKMVFRQPEKIFKAYGTTICTTTLGTVLSIMLQSGYGYVLSRQDYVWKNKLGGYLYFTMLFGGGMIPLYILITQYLHLKDNFWVLVIPLLGNGGNIYMFRNFFAQLPYSVIESAKIDGANEFTIFGRLVLPMTKTGIATIAIFVVLGFWNEWFYSMMYMTSEKVVTLQYLLTKLINNVTFFQVKEGMSGGMLSRSDVPAETLRMATVMVVVGPMMCVFPFFQKYFVRGLTGGAVKG